MRTTGVSRVGHLAGLRSAVCAIVGALAIADFADEIAAVARRHLAVLVELRGVLAVGRRGLACIAEVLLLLFSNGLVSLHGIRAVDRTLGADVPYLTAQWADHTQVLA